MFMASCNSAKKMATPAPLTILTVAILCTFFYILGSNNTTDKPLLQAPDCDIQIKNLTTIHPQNRPFLDFELHHRPADDGPPPQDHQLQHFFPYCPKNFTNYCPCQDPNKEKQFTMEMRLHRERHCPGKGEALRCLVPKPGGYRRPFLWPKSRDYAWFRNVPFKKLTEYKKSQNWVRLEGDRFYFPGGGTSFPFGVKGYIDELKHLVPLKSGAIRTVLDVGCGVASFGAYLMDYNILTMSIAPSDVHEAQVQFALERGLPAMLGVLSTHRLPYPSRSFDMAHCSRCLVQWTDYDGLYLLEIDRLLRPGGYWVLSGPPISWRISYRGWERTAEDLQNEQNKLEDLARHLCWRKVRERGPIAVWQKPSNHIHCAEKLKAWKALKFCAEDPDDGWYKKMEACITPLPKVADIHGTSGGSLPNWPRRLKSVPPRIKRGTLRQITEKTFIEDYQAWKRRISLYGSLVTSLLKGNYRNIMDMNAGLGGFAAALSEYPVWVMNVVPVDTGNNTLGVIYERGLIGSYMNWCEPFSTYPRTYDVVHAHYLFSIYQGKCDILDILFEIHRILRPEGAIIIRDHVDTIMKLKEVMGQMRWNAKVSHSELGPRHPEKLLFVDNSV